MVRLVKASKKAFIWFLALIMFIGGTSLHVVAEQAIAAYMEQDVLRSILDMELGLELPAYDDDDEFYEVPQPSGTGRKETSEAIRAAYADALQAETEAYETDRFIVKYADASSVPMLSGDSPAGLDGSIFNSFERMAVIAEAGVFTEVQATGWVRIEAEQERGTLTETDTAFNIGAWTDTIANEDTQPQPQPQPSTDADEDMQPHNGADINTLPQEHTDLGAGVQPETESQPEAPHEVPADTEPGAVRESVLISVTTEEPVTIAEFAQAMRTAGLGSGIEYIQPDYPMAMSANAIHNELRLAYRNSLYPLQIAHHGQPERSPLRPNPATQPEHSTLLSPLSTLNSSLSAPVIVAILDTGFDTSHPELAGRIYADPITGASGWDFVNNDGSVNDPETYTDQWHGTHIAGIIAEQAPEARILPLKVFEGGYAYTSDIISAIAYAESMGAQVINCSWGSRFDNPALREAIENGSSLFIASTGNNLYNLDDYPVYPAAYSMELDNVISVASVDETMKLSRFSNYGANTVDIAVYGENIESAWLEGAYQSISGTSMSAAAVSAAAALVLAQHGSYTAAETRQRIIHSADTVTGLGDKVINGRLLNAEYAISGATGPNLKIIDVPDDELLPVVIPNGEPEDDGYELYGAENYVTHREPMATARHGLQAVALGGNIYAIGGQTSESAGYTNSVERYDPVTDTWTPVSGMNAARSYFAAVVYDGLIYAMGGEGSSGSLSSIERYDPANDTWTTLAAALPVAMRSFTATLIPGTSSVYIIGGYATVNNPRNSVYEYDIALGTVTVRPNLSVPISNHVAFYYDGMVWLQGGLSTNGSHSPYEYKYSLVSNITSNPVNARVHTADATGILTNVRFISIGGRWHSNNTSDMMHSLLTTEHILGRGSYWIKSHLITARRGHSSVLHNGKVYTIGGLSNFGVLSTVEEMDLGREDRAMPPAVLKDFGTVSLDGKIYQMGGLQLAGGVEQLSNAVYVYNAADDIWEQRSTPMPIYAIEFSLTAAYGKIYLIGGRTATTSTGTPTVSSIIYEYDPHMDVWTEKTTMSMAKYNVASTLYNGSIYIVGGRISQASWTVTVEEYNPLSNTITAINNLPIVYTEPFVCILNNELHVFSDLTPSYSKLDTSGAWSYINADGSYWGGLHVMLNDTLYALIQHYSPIAASTFYRFSPNINMWETHKTFYHHYAAHNVVELDNCLYIFTGNSDFSSGFAAYTPYASAWTSTSPIVISGHSLGATVLNEQVYAAGGMGYSNAVNQTVYRNELERYDQNGQLWVERQVMQYARGGLGLSSANGKLYAIGGTDSTATALDYVEEYDPATNSWATKASIPSATTEMAIASHGNLIYIFGGRNAGGSVLNAVRIYNPAANTWTTAANMPIARFGAGAAVIDGKIYVAGGFTNLNTPTNVMQIYDPAANTWDTSKAQLPRPLGYAGVVAADTLYVIGGFDGTSEMSRVYEYSPVLDEWLSWAGPSAVRYSFGAAISSKGIYVISGRNISSSFNSVEFAAIDRLSMENAYRHHGDSRVNLTGNFSRTYSDMNYTSQGFNVEFTRTYNSNDTRESLYCGEKSEVESDIICIEKGDITWPVTTENTQKKCASKPQG